MIIIPELTTVLITPPRTGSTTLLRAAQAQYPHTMSIYRHMEADGVPHGYDRWRRIGVLRHPLARLWSLYNYCRGLPFIDPNDWRTLMHDDASSKTFGEWLQYGTVPFTHPHWLGLKFDPRYNVLHPIPEQRKSLYQYLRPDLGVELWKMDGSGLIELMEELHLPIAYSGLNTSKSGMPPHAYGKDIKRHLGRYFAWDYNHYEELP